MFPPGWDQGNGNESYDDASEDVRSQISLRIALAELRFQGMEECRPCYWMDRAIAPGAHEFLKGRGGLRAKILTDGQLRSSARLAEKKTDEHLSVASPFARERAW